MTFREALALPVEVAAFGVLMLRLILSWIFSIPARIIRWLDRLNYKLIRLRRRIAGDPLWKPIDYTHLRIPPPDGWAKISPEHRRTMEADNWVFLNDPGYPDAAPWQREPMPDLPGRSVISDRPVTGFKEPPIP